MNDNLNEKDGINLKEVFQRLKQIVDSKHTSLRFYLQGAAILVAAVFLVRLVMSPPMSTYSEVVAFTFPQSEKGKYPNGAPFSINDLTSRNVLESVWKENDLGSQGLSLQNFSDAVAIVPFADNEQFIRARYQGMLARKNLSTTDIAAMERDYRLELETQSKKNALLTLTLPFSSSISGSLAKKAVSDIPKAWSKQAIQQLGVVSIPIAENESVKDEILKKGSPFQIVDYFYKSADSLNLALNRIASYPGGDTLKDPESGLGIEDLKRRVADLNRYWILDFDNYVQQRNQASEIDIRSAEIRLKELQDKKLEYLAEAKTYKASLLDYDSIRQSSNGQDVSLRNQQNGSGVQIQGDAVQKLIDLGTQNKDSEFRQELVKKRVDAELKATAMDQEILRLDRRIAAAKRSTQKSNVDPEKMTFFTNEIWSQLIAISDSIKRIQAVQAAKFSDDDGQLYSAGAVNKSFATSLLGFFLPPVVILALIGLLIASIRLISSRNTKQEQIISNN